MSAPKKVLLVLPQDNMYQVQDVFDEALPGWKEVGRMVIWGETLVTLVSIPQSGTAQPESEVLADLRRREVLSFSAPEIVSSDSGVSAAEDTCEDKSIPPCRVLFGMNPPSGWFVLLISLDRGDLLNLAVEYIQSILHRDARNTFGVSRDRYKLNGVRWHRFFLPADARTAFWLERLNEEHPEEIAFSPAAQTVATELSNLPGLDWF